MEDDRLTRFSRMLAARHDRRGFATVAGALGLAALLGIESDTAAKKKKKKKKKKKGQPSSPPASRGASHGACCLRRRLPTR